MVGSVDHDGVVEDPFFREIGAHVADGIVDCLNAGEVVLHVAEIGKGGLCAVVHSFGPRVDEFPGGVLRAFVAASLELELAAAREVLGELQVFLEAHVVEKCHRRRPYGRGASLPVVEEGVRRRDVPERQLAERGPVLVARQPVAVRRLVVHHYEEGLAGRKSAVDYVLRNLRDVLRGVFAAVLRLDDLAVFLLPEPRVKVDTLVRVDHPAVPVGVAHRLGASEVPLADEGRIVARVAHVAADCLDVRRDVVEDGNAVFVAVFASQDSGAARRADRVCAKAVLEQHSLPCEPVDVRRLVDPRSVRADCVRGVVVGHDVEDVEALFLGGGEEPRAPAGNKRESGALRHKVATCRVVHAVIIAKLECVGKECLASLCEEY